MNSYLLTEMTYPEVEEALKTVKMAIIPVGAHEQHGPHMLESCDAVLAEKMANKLAERLFPNVIVAPTVNMGVSHHHLNFAGTISLRSSTLISILKDMIESLKHHGISQFLLLNAHGGNQSTLSVASLELSRELDVKVYYAKTTASAKTISQYVKSPLYGHSCEREVSEALYLAPHLVKINRLEKGDIQPGIWKELRPNKAVQGPYQYEEMTANGCIGDATQASEEIGRKIVEEALNNVETTIKEILELTTIRI